MFLLLIIYFTQICENKYCFLDKCQFLCVVGWEGDTEGLLGRLTLVGNCQCEGGIDRYGNKWNHEEDYWVSMK